MGEQQFIQEIEKDRGDVETRGEQQFIQEIEKDVLCAREGTKHSTRRPVNAC